LQPENLYTGGGVPPEQSIRGHCRVEVGIVPYFQAHETHRPKRCTVIFLLEILEKNNDECISISVIYWKKTGLLHTKISNHTIIYSS